MSEQTARLLENFYIINHAVINQLVKAKLPLFFNILILAVGYDL